MHTTFYTDEEKCTGISSTIRSNSFIKKIPRKSLEFSVSGQETVIILRMRLERSFCEIGKTHTHAEMEEFYCWVLSTKDRPPALGCCASEPK